MHVISHAIIIFVDIRGFSAWCEHVNVFQLLEEFLGTCYAHITTVFDGCYIKPLGDGAMIIQECSIPKSSVNLEQLLAELMVKICKMEMLFAPTCVDFGRQCGEKTLLKLGWGITRGFVALLTPTEVSGISDYVSVDINKCAKLCKRARPAGVLLDMIDFPAKPEWPKNVVYESCAGIQKGFDAVELELEGLTERIAVWSSLIVNGSALSEMTNGTPAAHTASPHLL